MIRRIQKRDGRAVPFAKQKIADAVERAQAAVGEHDPQFAGEVADVVEMALSDRYPEGRLRMTAAGSEPHRSDPPGLESSSREFSGGEIPGIEEIQDLVERALIELGRAPVAKAYILYRDRRARIRSALQVAPSQDGARGNHETAARAGVQRAPRVQRASGIGAWSKGRIVVALMDEADLPRASAEQVAARVEARVFDSGLKRISTDLIRELVDNELVGLGLAQALRRQRPVGLPRHELRAILSGAPSADEARAAGTNVEAAIAGGILRRYALEDVLGDAAAELHLAGEIDVVDLCRPHLALTQSVPAELLLRGGLEARSAFAALDEIAGIAATSAQGVVVDECAPLVLALVRGARPTAGGGSALGLWLGALAALARASERRIDLALRPSSAASPDSTGAAPAAARESGAFETVLRGPGSRAPRPRGIGALAPHARLIEELDLAESADGADRARAAVAPRLFLDGSDLLRLLEELPALRGAADRLLSAGRLVPTFGAAGERCAGPGITRGARERGALACAGAVAINLPRAARRAGAWREDALLENLAHAVASALEALTALQRFQRALAALDHAVGNLRSRVGYALVPVGLREALRWLNDGEASPEQGARVLAFLSEAAERFGAARGLKTVVTPYFGERAAVRFADLDREIFRASQPSLFESGAGPDERAAAYSCGFELGPGDHGQPAQPRYPGRAAGHDVGEALLLASLRSGAVHPPEMLRRFADRGDAEDADRVHPTLARWERLERARSHLRSGAHALHPGAHALHSVPALPAERTLELDLYALHDVERGATRRAGAVAPVANGTSEAT